MGDRETIAKAATINENEEVEEESSFAERLAKKLGLKHVTQKDADEVFMTSFTIDEAAHV